MEPRARAGKNVGKQNFKEQDLIQLLYAHGDVRHPLPETVRVLDEILTEFVQGLSFEAAQAAQWAGRQKVKFEDFEFALRDNPLYLGKVQEVFEKKAEIEAARKSFVDDEDGGGAASLAHAEAAAEKRERRAAERAEKAELKRAAQAAAAAATTAPGAVDGAEEEPMELLGAMDAEELGEADDDVDAEGDALAMQR